MKNKIILDETYDSIFFTIDAFILDLNKEITEQVENIINNENSDRLEICMDNYRECVSTAEQLVKYSDYNYAMVTLNWFCATKDGESECVECVVVAEMIGGNPEEKINIENLPKNNLLN